MNKLTQNQAGSKKFLIKQNITSTTKSLFKNPETNKTNTEEHSFLQPHTNFRIAICIPKYPWVENSLKCMTSLHTK